MDAVQDEVTKEFLRAARVYASAVRDLMEEDVLRVVAGDRVTIAQLKLLFLVARTGEFSIGDAAAFLAISPSAASKSVDKLVRSRLLRRVETKGDRRTTQLCLTEASRRLLEAFETARKKRTEEVFAQFCPDELKQASELLDRLAAAVFDHSSNPPEVCLHCGIYFREKCRFGELSRRVCLYQRHESQDAPAPMGSPG
jgi:DNA-binding MarR family transcriptional regulator